MSSTLPVSVQTNNNHKLNRDPIAVSRSRENMYTIWISFETRIRINRRKIFKGFRHEYTMLKYLIEFWKQLLIEKNRACDLQTSIMYSTPCFISNLDL